MNSEPLVEAELDQLGDLLARFGGQDGMNPEELDGFFAALICGPSNVLPSEYLPEIMRDGIVDAMSTQSALQELISLVTRHWNTICNYSAIRRYFHTAAPRRRQRKCSRK